MTMQNASILNSLRRHQLEYRLAESNIIRLESDIDTNFNSIIGGCWLSLNIRRISSEIHQSFKFLKLHGILSRLSFQVMSELINLDIVRSQGTLEEHRLLSRRRNTFQ